MSTIALNLTPDERQARVKARRTLTYLLLFAIVMFFAGLTSAYVVSMSSGYWVRIALPTAFYVSTAFILLSTLTVQMALTSARKGVQGRVAPLLVATLVLGLGFTWSQVKGWSQLVEKGNYAVGGILRNSGEYGRDYTISRQGVQLEMVDGRFYLPEDTRRMNPLNAELEEQKNTASSYLYTLTFAHMAHLFFGLLALVVMLVTALRGGYAAGQEVGLWSGTVYWHFLTGLWIYLLLFLLVVH
ncbi:MAG: hypothetical protein JNM31_03765 [Flavobacteriales bacterium]|nr:hypothetical protein [Flavobacteriales bacterium]